MDKQLLQTLPSSIRKRVEFLGPFYVQTIDAIERDKNIPKKRRLRPSSSATRSIQLMVFANFVIRFIEDGDQAIKATVEALADLDQASLQIGTTEYRKGSAAYEYPSRALDALRELIVSLDLPEIVMSETSPRRLIETLYDEIPSYPPVD